MDIPVFLSISSPINDLQEKFKRRMEDTLRRQGFKPLTLGQTDYDIKAPLAGCRRLMLECNGLITLAFRRNKIEKAIPRPGKNDDLSGKWTTSAFCQIEPAMAYQLGLPILIMREKGVIDDGVLEKDVVGQYMPSFDLETDEKIDEFFSSILLKDLLLKWGHNVYTTWDKKGRVERF